jgi:hypothetical protein
MLTIALMTAFGPPAEADAPAGHRIGLGGAVGDDAVLQPRLDLGDGAELEAVIDQVLVHVVGHDPDMRVLQHHLGQRLHLLARAPGAGRVVREVQHHPSWSAA